MPYDFSGIAKHAGEVTSALLAKNHATPESAKALDYYLVRIQQNAASLQKIPGDAELLTQMAVHTGLATHAARLEKSERLPDLEKLNDAIASSDNIAPVITAAALAISLKNYTPDGDVKHRVLTMKEHRSLIKALDRLEDTAHAMTTGVVGRPANYNPDIYFTKDLNKAFDEAIKAAQKVGKADIVEALTKGKENFEMQGKNVYQASLAPAKPELPPKVAEAALEAVKPQPGFISETQPILPPKPSGIASQLTP